MTFCVQISQHSQARYEIKFRLSTSLLALSIPALSFAWYSDRTRIQRELDSERATIEERLDNIWRGVSASSAAHECVLVSRTYKKRPSDSKFGGSIRDGLIATMLEVWMDEHHIEAAFENDGSATTLGNDIITLLDCATTDDYFQLAREWARNDVEAFPEIHDTESPAHKSFRSFVQRSIDTERVTEWGW